MTVSSGKLGANSLVNLILQGCIDSGRKILSCKVVTCVKKKNNTMNKKRNPVCVYPYCFDAYSAYSILARAYKSAYS